MTSSTCAFFLVVILSGCTSLQDSATKKKPDPLADVAASILKEQNAQHLGGLVQNLLQQDGGRLIKEALGKIDSKTIMEGLGNVLAKQKNNEDGSGNILDALQGLGPLLGGNQEGKGGINTELIGSLIGNFVSQIQESPKEEKRSQRDNVDFDMGDIMSLAGQYLSQNVKKNNDMDMLSFLSMIGQTLGAFIGPEADQRSEEHAKHSWMLPPALERFHILFDHFIHSEFGQYLLSSIGAEKAFKVFTDETGRFSYKKFGELMENHSFRRHWIRMVTDRIATLLHYVTDPKLYKTYLTTGQYFINSYLKGRGFPKATLFDPERPTETLSALLNHISKKYFDLKINSKEYVKPAVEYIQDILRLSLHSNAIGDNRNSMELSNKLADTINLEIIEPMVRVNRAYRFAKIVPKCDRYVMCLINENNQNEVENLPVLKKLLYRGSSLLAGWFLTSKTGTPFWTLYMDIVEGGDCKALYSAECNDFHLEEIKVTTEYIHNEL